MKKLTKQRIIFVAILIGISNLFITTIVFANAFFNDAKVSPVYINMFGEQYLDIIVLIGFWIFSVAGFILCLKEKKNAKFM